MKQELLAGKIFVFENEEGDRQAEISFSDHLSRFIIWFNGQIIHSSKTFPPLEKRLEKLKDKWKLNSID